MIRPILASLAAGALALSLTAAPAEARPRGGAVAAGAIIGLAAGAIIGSALAGRHAHDDRVVTYHPDYAPGHYYAQPGYHAARPYARHRYVGRPTYPPGYTVYEPGEVY